MRGLFSKRIFKILPRGLAIVIVIYCSARIKNMQYSSAACKIPRGFGKFVKNFGRLSPTSRKTSVFLLSFLTTIV